MCWQIYFSGFSDEQLEKLHRIVNLGGGARLVLKCSVTFITSLLFCRYDHLSENISHVVMGKQEPSELEAVNCW